MRLLIVSPLCKKLDSRKLCKYHYYIIAYIIEFKGVKVPVLHQIYNLWLHDARSKSTMKTWKTRNV